MKRLLPPLAVLLLSALAALPLAAQPPGGRGPSPAGYTEARSHQVRSTVRLTGSVVARESSVVAAEVAGSVVELAKREGDAVRRGEALVRLRRDARELDLAARRAALEEAEARLDLARRTLGRSRELFDSQVISRQTLDDAVSEQAAWQGRVENLEAEIARVEDDLERLVVRAPFSGVVVRERTQVGEWVTVGGPVSELVSLDNLEVRLDVPERYYGSLRRGTAARVTFEALPGVELDGELTAVIPRADAQARAFPVKIRFADPQRQTGVGMLARVDLPVGRVEAATVVPKDAVVRRGREELVYRIGGEGVVEEVAVETGTAVGVWIEVRGGVAPGDRVITRGNERLRPGQRVAGEPVSYDPPEGGTQS